MINLAGLLYAALVGRWPGTEGTAIPAAPTEHGRPLRIDKTRERLIDGRGRRFPPHWEYEPITGNWDDRWWGHYRNAIRRREWWPTHTYWRRRPSLVPPWEEAT